MKITSKGNSKNLVLYTTLDLSQQKSLNLDNPFKNSITSHNNTPSTKANKNDRFASDPIKNPSEKFLCAFDEIQAEYDAFDAGLKSGSSRSSLFSRNPEEAKKTPKNNGESCYLLNKPLGVTGIKLEHNKYKKRDSFGEVKEQMRMKRKALIELNNKMNGIKSSIYLYQMKQMVKKVSTIIYYHILHSHQHNSKPSKMANLFNEKKLLQKKEGHVMVVDSSPSFSAGVVFHTDIFPTKVKIDSTLSKYKIYEFIEILLGSLNLHLECVLISLAYLEKLMTKKGLEIRASNWRPLLLTCMILATKYWEEGGYWNSDFAEVTNFPVDVINELESVALNLLDYKLYLSSQLYSEYYLEVRSLYRKVKKTEEKKRKKEQYKKYGVVPRKPSRIPL